MKYRLLGKTNLSVSAIGFGGIPIQKCTQSEANALIEKAFLRGINFIDSARGYGASEKRIGEAIKRYPNHFIIASKSPAKDYETMKADITLSLKDMQLSSIDLYQCHFIKDLDQYHKITSKGGALEALVEAKEKGFIKHIGMTAHNKDVLAHALRDNCWETVQFPYNFVETQATELFQVAFEKNVGIIVMKPLAGGAITDAPLAMRFLLNNPHLTTAIVGVDSPSQIEENTAIFTSDFTLTQRDKEKIQAFVDAHQDAFCRRCGYCGPCPEGIDIPLMFTLEGYFKRYDLSEWAKMRYQGLPIGADACVGCGLCETKCPYDLKIRNMLKTVSDTFL